MRLRSLAVAALAAASLALASNNTTAADQSIVVAASVEQTQTIDPAIVAQLPAIEQKVSFQTSHGPEQAAYMGALLWSVFERAKMLGGDRRAQLRQTILVTGRDGYAAALALAEIDPDFEGKQVLLAYRRDGQPIEGHALRLVVPGDRYGGRSVRDVVRIELH
ncbi:MAG TPA: molybdopterin-dependent oxidoreductase [Stellaceae bacterium]|nr:molybdopterin-dependent oxidoreductase [Stellaceae bacterium]